MWQIDPEKSLSLLDQPMEIRKKCEAEAEAMVKKTNAVQVSRLLSRYMAVHVIYVKKICYFSRVFNVFYYKV